MAGLKDLSADVEDTAWRVRVPAYVIDRSGCSTTRHEGRPLEAARPPSRSGDAWKARRMKRSESVRVLTMNLFAQRADWTARRSVLMVGLQELRPDIVAFQEALKNERYDQVVDVLGTDYHVFHQSGRSADGCGASVASRWSLEVLREADLHVTDRVDPAGWIGSVAVTEIAVPKADRPDPACPPQADMAVHRGV